MTEQKELYIGVMSGTSFDAVDVVLIEVDSSTTNNNSVRLLHSHSHELSDQLKARLLNIVNPHWRGTLLELGELDRDLGLLFGHAVNGLLRRHNIDPRKVIAVGCHGQTIAHHPQQRVTMQFGDPNTITSLTNIDVVSDFRRMDVAVGGQGAPLVPAFHYAVLRSEIEDRAVVNIGGIGNVTVLRSSPDAPSFGFDTGPGNVLLDAWASLHIKTPYDNFVHTFFSRDGAWARTGSINTALLENLLLTEYFHRLPPKSTGRELFHLEWVQAQLKDLQISPEDVQATLTALTAKSIALAIRNFSPSCQRLLLCGGGVHNAYLMELIQYYCGEDIVVCSTAALEIDPDMMEAMAFAWLAYMHVHRRPANVLGNGQCVTGAARDCVLGGRYCYSG